MEIKVCCLVLPLVIYLAGGDFSGPSSRRKNIPPVPLGRGPQEPKNSQQIGWEHPIPGTSSSSRAAQEINVAKKLCIIKG